MDVGLWRCLCVHVFPLCLFVSALACAYGCSIVWQGAFAWYIFPSLTYSLKVDPHCNGSRGVSSACRCTCGECGAPAFLVFNSKTTYEKLLALDRMKVEGGIKCGLQTVKPKASTLGAFVNKHSAMVVKLVTHLCTVYGCLEL